MPWRRPWPDDLHSWLDSRPIAARRVGSAERAWLWGKRRPAFAVLAAATLLTLVACTVAVIAIQGMANTDLRTANISEQQRFKLALAAIRLLHDQVDDLVLKADQFKPLAATSCCATRAFTMTGSKGCSKAVPTVTRKGH